MARGFVYLAAVIAWFSRRVLAFRGSIDMDGSFCMEAVEAALDRYGAPAICNTAQGSQFTRLAFPRLLRDHGIAISMDGRGAGRDTVFGERLWRSVNYEEVYLRADDTVSDARASSAISGLLQGPTAALEPCPQAPHTACFNALRPIPAAAEPRQKST